MYRYKIEVCRYIYPDNTNIYFFILHYKFTINTLSYNPLLDYYSTNKKGFIYTKTALS